MGCQDHPHAHESQQTLAPMWVPGAGQDLFRALQHSVSGTNSRQSSVIRLCSPNHRKMGNRRGDRHVTQCAAQDAQAGRFLVGPMGTFWVLFPGFPKQQKPFIFDRIALERYIFL
jgi:hypothetical protein